MTDLAVQVAHLAKAVQALTEFNAILVKKLEEVSAPVVDVSKLPDNRFELLHLKLDALGEFAAAQDEKLDKIGELISAQFEDKIISNEKPIKSKN